MSSVTWDLPSFRHNETTLSPLPDNYPPPLSLLASNCKRITRHNGRPTHHWCTSPPANSMAAKRVTARGNTRASGSEDFFGLTILVADAPTTSRRGSQHRARYVRFEGLKGGHFGILCFWARGDDNWGDVVGGIAGLTSISQDPASSWPTGSGTSTTPREAQLLPIEASR